MKIRQCCLLHYTSFSGQCNCVERPSHISTVWGQTSSFKITMLDGTGQGLSATTSNMREGRGWNGLPTVVTLTPVNSYGIILAVLSHFWGAQPSLGVPLTRQMHVSKKFLTIRRKINLLSSGIRFFSKTHCSNKDVINQTQIQYTPENFRH